MEKWGIFVHFCDHEVVNVFQIEGDGSGMGEERETRLFPDKDHENQKITCHDITPEFLIYGTDVRKKNSLYKKLD